MKPIRVADSGEWARWLEAHSDAREVWLVIRKKNSKKPGVFLEEAVEQAIVHGWIDSQMKPVDSDMYILRFTPRRDDGPWSMRNRRVAERLIEEGRMSTAGLACVEAAKRNGRWESAYTSKTPPKVPEYIEKELKSRGAWERFSTLSNSSRTQYIYWIEEGKKVETRSKRINELVSTLAGE